MKQLKKLPSDSEIYFEDNPGDYVVAIRSVKLQDFNDEDKTWQKANFGISTPPGKHVVLK